MSGSDNLYPCGVLPDRWLLTLITILLATVIAQSFTVSAAASNTSFPRVVHHAFGTTKLSGPPNRIVSIGVNSEDSILAVGRVPIAFTKNNLFDSGIAPWSEPYIKGNRPYLLDGSVIDYEMIAALKPDIIFAIRTNIDRLQWEKLSAIAPTIAYGSGPGRASWQEQIQLVGEALAESDRAAEIIGQIEKDLKSLIESNPKLKEKSFALGTYFPGTGRLGFYLKGDPRIEMFTDLHLLMAPSMRALQKRPEQWGSSITFENLDQVDSDMLIIMYPAGGREEAERQEVFQRINAVRSGSYIALDEPSLVWAVRTPSVLSIPYGFPSFIRNLSNIANMSDETGR